MTDRLVSSDDYRFYWLERRAGEGAFSQRLLYEGSRPVEDVRPVDVDGDGDKDLLVTLRDGELAPIPTNICSMKTMAPIIFCKRH